MVDLDSFLYIISHWFANPKSPDFLVVLKWRSSNLRSWTFSLSNVSVNLPFLLIDELTSDKKAVFSLYWMSHQKQISQGTLPPFSYSDITQMLLGSSAQVLLRWNTHRLSDRIVLGSVLEGPYLVRMSRAVHQLKRKAQRTESRQKLLHYSFLHENTMGSI